MAAYLDTSALVKLVVEEAESRALRSWLSETAEIPVSSDLARTELLRAVRRAEPAAARQAREVLDAITLLRTGPDTFEDAARLDPPELRSLDAVHLAAALRLGDDLDCVITYDDRLEGAAAGLGIRVIHPGTGDPAGT